MARPRQWSHNDQCRDYMMHTHWVCYLASIHAWCTGLYLDLDWKVQGPRKYFLSTASYLTGLNTKRAQITPINSGTPAV